MAYPTLPATYQSGENCADDIQPDRSSSGALRTRVFYTAPKRVFRLQHGGLSAAQKSTFDAFYSANRAASFSFTWPADGATYTCVFTRPPARQPVPGGWWNIDVELGEV